MITLLILATIICGLSIYDTYKICKKEKEDYNPLKSRNVILFFLNIIGFLLLCGLFIIICLLINKYLP